MGNPCGANRVVFQFRCGRHHPSIGDRPRRKKFYAGRSDGRNLLVCRRAAGDRSGHFLLFGSASLDLMRQASESLAGRIAQPRTKYLVHGGSDNWPRPGGVTAVGLLELAEHLAATR